MTILEITGCYQDLNLQLAILTSIIEQCRGKVNYITNQTSMTKVKLLTLRLTTLSLLQFQAQVQFLS